MACPGSELVRSRAGMRTPFLLPSVPFIWGHFYLAGTCQARQDPDVSAVHSGGPAQNVHLSPS